MDVKVSGDDVLDAVGVVLLLIFFSPLIVIGIVVHGAGILIAGAINLFISNKD